MLTLDDLERLRILLRDELDASAELAACETVVRELRADLAAAQRIVLSLAARVAAQSEILGRKAEGR